MKHSVKLIIDSSTEKYLQAEDGSTLLHLIRDNTDDFYAPCGGNGTCGKCRVFVPGEGHVTACLYSIQKDIEVILPPKKEMKILSTQYELTRSVNLNPGDVVNKAVIPYGVAIDIGTTTIVFYIVNLLLGSVVDIISKSNPQAKYGADVISRISYSAGSSEGVRNLQKVLVDLSNETIREYCSRHDLSPNDFVKIAVVGNTIMLHSFLGINALSIAHAPFRPVFTDTKRTKASKLGIQIHPEGEIVILTSLSGYVGADIIAGFASLDESKLNKNVLYIDIGTNGEMLLLTQKGCYACATAAGPAFEGANISHGMGATTGAISAYSVNGFQVVGNTQPTGICGSGLIDVIAFMLDSGIMKADGNIRETFKIWQGEKGDEITVNQKDVRELQLAKSAIFTGIKLLIAKSGIKMDEIDQVFLAGGFGNYLNIRNAIRIGLLPDIPEDKYNQVGNAAGTGAVLALKSNDFLASLENIRNKMEYIDLSTDPDFAMEFAMNMFFEK